jgi:hypothetical protein
MDQLSVSQIIYQTIRQRILEVEGPIDEATLADTLEGLTNLHEAVAAVVRAALLDETLAEGLNIHVEALQVRLMRLNERAAARRQIARDAMLQADLKKIAAPDFTVTLRAGSSSVVVVEERTVPQAYWVHREPRLDRQRLLQDLKQGLVIEGARLSTPEPVLSVRIC